MFSVLTVITVPTVTTVSNAPTVTTVVTIINMYVNCTMAQICFQYRMSLCAAAAEWVMICVSKTTD